MIGKDPAPKPKNGFILLMLRALRNISNLVTFKFPIPSAANSNHTFLGIISLRRFCRSPVKDWEIVTINIELIKRIDGTNHRKLLDPTTKGIDPMIHAQERLELVKIAASPTVIKKIKERYCR